MKSLIGYVLAILLVAGGCRSSREVALREPSELPATNATPSVAAESSSEQVLLSKTQPLEKTPEINPKTNSAVKLTSYVDDDKSADASPQSSPLPRANGELTATEELPALPDPVTLNDVVVAVYASYPSLDAVSRERQIAAGKQLAAMGKFDVTLVADAIAQPLAYYKNYRYNAGVKRYEWSGAQTFAGYRLGRGFFEPWYKERQTNDGGEFKAGALLPFLRDRAIDERRAAVFQAQIDQQAADPLLQAEVIDTVRAASQTYWEWVAAGQRVRIAQRILDLASDRQSGMETRANRGEIAGIELIDNERLIVARQAKLIEAQLKLQQSAIQLSLFLRDPAGTPLLASPEQLPINFPELDENVCQSADQLIAAALSNRPELRLISLEQQRQQVEIKQASNVSLPGLDGVLVASQDVGAAYSPLRDKSPFELEAGLTLDVPLERRAARGKLLEAQGKLAQLAAKQRLAEQSIIAEVQTAEAAIQANIKAIAQARQNVQLAIQLADAERTKLARGDSDVLTVNLREIATVDAELLLVEAEANYFKADAQLRAAIAAELTTAQAGPTDVHTQQSNPQPCLE